MQHRPDYKFFPKKTLYKPLKQLIEVEAGSEPAAEARDNGWQRYGTSKLLQMMIGHEVCVSSLEGTMMTNEVACPPTQDASPILGHQRRHV
jgi:hypothetical protein